VWFFLLATFADFSSRFTRHSSGGPAVRRAGLSAFFVAGLSTGFMVNFFGKWSLQGSVFIQFTFLP